MSPVREKGRHKVRHRLGADSSISLQRSSRLRPSLTVVISCHSTSIRSISTIHVPDRSSLSFIEPCPSTLGRRSRFLDRQSSLHPSLALSSLTGNARLQTETRAATLAAGTRNLRSPSQAAEASARKTARGRPRNRTAGAGVLFRVGTAPKSNRKPVGKRLTCVHANH
jgi:hypothetical protein